MGLLRKKNKEEKKVMVPVSMPEFTISAVVECPKCEYWGTMLGYRTLTDKGPIATFVCECGQMQDVRWF